MIQIGCYEVCLGIPLRPVYTAPHARQPLADEGFCTADVVSGVKELVKSDPPTLTLRLAMGHKEPKATSKQSNFAGQIRVHTSKLQLRVRLKANDQLSKGSRAGKCGGVGAFDRSSWGEFKFLQPPSKGRRLVLGGALFGGRVVLPRDVFIHFEPNPICIRFLLSWRATDRKLPASLPPIA